MKKQYTIGKIFVPASVIICMMLQFMVFGVIPASAAIVDMGTDDFSSAIYNPDTVLTSGSGWNGSFNGSGVPSGVPSGEPSTCIVRENDLLPGGKDIENCNNNGSPASTLLSMTKAIPNGGISYGADKQYYIKWNVYVGTIGSSQNNILQLKLYSTAAAIANNVNYYKGGSLSLGLRYNSTTGQLWPSVFVGSTDKMPAEASYNGPNFPMNRTYTIIAHISTVSTAANDTCDLKIYEYGTPEPDAYTVSGVVLGTGNTTQIVDYSFSASHTSSTGTVNTTDFPAGSVRFGDLQFTSYDSTDMANAATVFSDAASLNPSFSNIDSTGNITLAKTTGVGNSGVAWVSSDPDFIAIENGVANVIKQPGSGEGIKQMCLTATITSSANPSVFTKKSFPVTILEEALPPALVMGDPDVYLDSVPTTALVPNGLTAGNLNLTAKLPFNNTTGVNHPVALVMALYDGNTLKTLAYTEDTINGNRTAPITANMTASISAQDASDYKLKVFVWDSLNGMQPEALISHSTKQYVTQ